MVLRALTAVLIVGASAVPASAAIAAPAAPESDAPVTGMLVHIAPRTIDASGATDVTDQLNAFFASVPNGGTISLRTNGRYRVNGTLSLANRTDVTLDGNGSMIFAATEGSRDRSQLSIDKGSRIVIRDLSIKGANPIGGLAEGAYRSDKAFQHGIRILGAHDVEVDRVQISDTFGDLIYISDASDFIRGDHTFAERVWIHNSYLTRNGRQGIAVTAARDVVIERNTITVTRRATIDLEPDTPTEGASGIFILNNQIGPGLLRFVAAHGNGPVDHVVIAYNRLHGRDLAIDIAPPSGARRSSFYVIDNFSDRLSRGDPLRFTRLDGVVVQGNTQPILVNRSVIAATDVCGLTVKGNDFWESGTIVRSTGPTCPASPPPPMPSPPDLIGRTLPRPAPSTPSSSTPAGATPPPAAPASEGSDTVRAVGAAAVVALVAAVVILLWVRRRRRPRPQEGDPPPPAH